MNPMNDPQGSDPLRQLGRVEERGLRLVRRHSRRPAGSPHQPISGTWPTSILLHTMFFSKHPPTYLFKELSTDHDTGPIKGGFFQKERIRFSNLQISKIKIFQKNYPELEI